MAHVTEQSPQSRLNLQVGSVAATPGATFVTSTGGAHVTVSRASADSVSLTIEVMTSVPVDRTPPAVASWGPERIDVFARGLDEGSFHKAWAQAWHPGPNDWEAIGGGFM